MPKYLIFLFFVSVGLLSACAQKALINVKRPGELNLKGVSKIAIIEFNTINSEPELGRFPVKPDTLALAKKSLTDIFYKYPFYSLVDLSLEKHLDPSSRIKRKRRFDALIYGKLWWQISGEYDNFKPAKFTLETWKIKTYVCGHDKKGRPKHCSAHLTTSTKDRFYKNHYRAVTASLMLSLSVYKMNQDGQDGRIQKLTQVFELATQNALIKNGVFYPSKPALFGASTEKDRAEALKTDESFLGSVSEFFGTEKKSQKVTGDKGVTRAVKTIPADLEFKIVLLDEIGKTFQEMIAPHYEEFEVSIPFESDVKSSSLLQCSAYQGLIKYIVDTKLANGYGEFSQFFYEMDFRKGAEEVVNKTHRDNFDKENQKRKVKERKPYVPLTPDELKEAAESHLKDHVEDIYNLALSFEAIGDYERALEIYRFGFENYKSEDQSYADGIGRCLFALDMADRLIEKKRTKKRAERDTKL